MSYKLFLDDYRSPSDCAPYMRRRIGPMSKVYLEDDWVIVRSFDQFVALIKFHGRPVLISFDHDLADEHMSMVDNRRTDWEDYYLQSDREMTGYDCARWLVEFCIKMRWPLPDYFVHSMNPVGTENIHKALR